ncbi:hypothetical protein B4098_3176 [Heyndrickxia coagulans]|uniref:Uncharacterized protein n=1 Tax=Heyndrickxia coagulans TaxID=1398 RepID=A0A150K5G8_HEYCO|nr:hypothetical protein B4098_3176 [Heyndrickxia coagulans]
MSQSIAFASMPAFFARAGTCRKSGKEDIFTGVSQLPPFV